MVCVRAWKIVVARYCDWVSLGDAVYVVGRWMKLVSDAAGQCAWLWTKVCEVLGVVVRHGVCRICQ